MGKKGDKRRAKQRAKQLAESQRRRPAERSLHQSPKPKARKVPDRQTDTARQKLTRLGPQGTRRPKGPSGPMTPEMLPESEYISIEWPPKAPNAPSIQFTLKITERIANVSRGSVQLKAMPIEDTIHPRPLGFSSTTAGLRPAAAAIRQRLPPQLGEIGLCVRSARPIR